MKRILLLLSVICLSCSQTPQTLDELRTAGKDAFVSEDYTSAINYLNQALHIKSSDRDALYFIGQSFHKLNKDDSAVYYYKRADILYPNNRELNQAIYISAKLCNDYTNSIKAINILIRTGDAPEQYYAELADFNLRSDNIYVSFLYLRKIYEEGSDNPAVYLSLGNVATQVDSVLYAIDVIKAGIQKFGELEQLMVDLAIYTATIDKLPEAEKILRNLLVKNPTSENVRYTLGAILAKNDSKTKKEEGLQLYQKLRVEHGNVQSLDSLIIDLFQQIESL